MYTMSAIVICILSFIVACGAAFALAKWAFKKDTEIENRRRAAAKLAGKLESYGLVRIPKFLVDYSVGDYSGMAKGIHDFAELFLNGESAVVTEFDKVFERVLTEKLNTESGRALIAAKLHDSVAETDPSSVQDAPTAAVKS
jgi:hypothetical protein